MKEMNREKKEREEQMERKCAFSVYNPAGKKCEIGLIFLLSQSVYHLIFLINIL